MTREYSCSRTTRRWPFRVFMEILDMAALNAYILWLEKNPNWRKNDRSRRRYFLKVLRKELVTNNVHCRNAQKYFHNKQKISIRVFLGNSNVINSPEYHNEKMTKRRRCEFCPHNDNRKTNSLCHYCNKYVCNKHKITYASCLECKEN